MNQILSAMRCNATVLHETDRWSVLMYRGGLYCELVFKLHSHTVASEERSPSIFMQGEAASEFLQQLEDAQRSHTSEQVDNLLLSGYVDALPASAAK